MLRVSKTAPTILCLMVALSLLAPLLYPAGGEATNLTLGIMPPSLRFPLGTDDYGRNMLARLLHASRLSLSAAVLSSTVAILPSLVIATLATFTGHVSKSVINSVNTVLLAIPGLIMALTVVALLGVGVWTAAIAVGASLQPIYHRLVWSHFDEVLRHTYVVRVSAKGGTKWHITLWHMLPLTLQPLLTYAIVIYTYAVLSLAGLGFLGVVGTPSTPTLGIMFDQSRRLFRQAPWIALAVGSWLTLFVSLLMTVSSQLDAKNAIQWWIAFFHEEEKVSAKRR